MGRVNNQNSGSLADLERRIRALETATPMNNAAVGRSGFEVYDGGTIDITSGTLRVNGEAIFTGRLNANGIITLSGTLRLPDLPTSESKPNLFVSASGQLHRSTSA